MKSEEFLLLNSISQSIFDKKGMNILALDVRASGVGSDYVIIAEGSVDRHLKAIALFVQKNLEDRGWTLSFVQGLESGGWIVLDFTHIVIHLFEPREREKYQLEQLFEAAEIVDVVIDVPENRCLII